MLDSIGGLYFGKSHTPEKIISVITGLKVEEIKEVVIKILIESSSPCFSREDFLDLLRIISEKYRMNRGKIYQETMLNLIVFLNKKMNNN